MKQIVILLQFFFVQLAIAQDPWKNVYRESAWTERDKWQRPNELIKLLNIRQGTKAADIGCHEGYMTIKLSLAAGSSGEVIAVDIDQSKLNLLKKHLEERKINNVTLVKGDYDNPKLPANQLDGVIILDAYHEMDDHDKILQHIKSASKEGGGLVICEPISESRRKLSRGEQEQKHELGINFAAEDLKRAGFEITYQKDPFVDRTKVKGDTMWVIVATKK